MRKVLADFKLRKANKKLLKELGDKDKSIDALNVSLGFKDSVINNKTKTILKQQRLIDDLRGSEDDKITNSK